MANNDPRAGNTGPLAVATDDVSGVHYQRVKLVDGTEDSSTNIPGNTHGLFVQTRHPTTARNTFTITAGTLAQSATVGRASAAVDFSTAVPTDVMIEASVSIGSTAGVVELYGLGSLNGTIYNGDVPGYTGTDTSYTLLTAGSQNLPLIGTVRLTNTAIMRGLFSVRQAFGFVPPWLSILVINNTGAPLTHCTLAYMPVW